MDPEFDGEPFVPIILTLVEAARDPEVRESWRLVAWVSMVALLTLIGYASRLAGGKPAADALYKYETAIGGIIVYGILLTILLWITHGLPRRELFALRRPGSWAGALGLAFGAYVAIFLGAGAILIALNAQDEQGLTPESWDSSRAGAYAANFVAVAFVGPVVEELAYRGAGLSLLARWGAPVAIAVTSIGFGLGHGLLLALPALVWFGVVTALLRLKTNSIYPCMLVHCAFNATSLVLAVAV